RPVHAGLPVADDGPDRPGPCHSPRNAPPTAADSAAGASDAHSRPDASPTDRAAVRERRGVARTGTRESRWQADDRQRDQTAREDVAGRLAEGLNRWPCLAGAPTAERRPWPAEAPQARRRLFFLDRPHHLGREEPAQVAGAHGRDFVDIDPTDGALLELERM